VFVTKNETKTNIAIVK